MNAPKEFSTARLFAAPRGRVFEAWSQAEQLAKWWGPKGFAIQVRSLDFRPGGLFHYSMQIPGGGQMWGRFIYREIAVPERIVFVNSFSDAQGGVTRAPFSPTWPLEALNTVTFTEEGTGTRLDLRGRPVNASAIEQQTFEGGFASMQQGFGGTWDQLGAYLAGAQ